MPAWPATQPISRDLVYPQRHLQERLYSILPFLAKHGTGLIDDLYECLNLDCPDHQLAVV